MAAERTTEPKRLAGVFPGIAGWARRVAGLVVLAAVLGPARAGGEDSSGEHGVVVITPHVDAIRYEFGRAFAAWSGAEVEWRNVGGTADAVRFVQSEFASKPEGIGIDCLFGGGLEPYLLLADKHLLGAYRPPKEILAGIPREVNGVQVYDAQYRWFGVVLSSFGILQNLRVQRIERLAPARRWEDLAQPALFGWVGAGDPRNSGTMNVMFEAFLQYFGWDKGWRVLTEIGGNVRAFDRVSSATAKAATLGETAYAFAIDFYGFTQVAAVGRTNLSFALAQDFTAISPDGIALLKGAPHPAAARRFIDFVLSDAGQKLWLLPRGHPEGPQRYSIERMPVRPELYRRYREVSNVEFSPFEVKQSFVFDAKLSRARREVVAALVGALLVDTHTELQAAWRAIRKRQLPAPDLAELGRMPVSEAEAMRLATGPWKDPAFRNLKKIEWQRWAEDKYRRLARKGGAAGRP